MAPFLWFVLQVDKKTIKSGGFSWFPKSSSKNFFLLALVFDWGCLDLLLNFQAPTPKPNLQTLVDVPYNSHYRILISEKMCSKLTNCKKIICKSIHKDTHFWMTKLASHTWISFLGQVSMHDYSSWYPLAHDIISKGTEFL